MLDRMLCSHEWAPDGKKHPQHDYFPRAFQWDACGELGHQGFIKIAIGSWNHSLIST